MKKKEKKCKTEEHVPIYLIIGLVKKNLQGRV